MTKPARRPQPWWRRVLRLGPSQSELHASVGELVAAVRELSAAQRQHTAQIKKLRDAQQAADARWRAALEVGNRESNDARRNQDAAQKQWQGELDALEHAQKAERKWRVIFARQIDAVLRSMQITRLPIPPPYDITARRFRLRSQNEEDGIILALLERAGWGNRRFVEIGSGRSGGNAAFLAFECGWSGLMVDIEPAAVAGARRRFAHNPGVRAVVSAVSPENVNDLLRTHGFDGEVELLSIDIDSYDYWVLHALTACSPRLLVLEYNAGFGPRRAVTIPLNQPLAGAPKGYRGASLAALDALARAKGYRLVACEAGVNAFFLRHDVAPEVPGVSVDQAFRPASSRLVVDDASAGEEGADLTIGNTEYPLVEV